MMPDWAHSSANVATAPDASDERSLRRAQIELLALAEGFFASRILFALHRLGAFELLGHDRMPLEAIAERLRGRPDTLARLLNAGVALGVLDVRQGDHYAVKPRWHPILADPAGDAYLGNWLKLLDNLSSSMADLDRAALEGGPTIDPLWAKKPEDVRPFILAMHDYAALRGEEIVHFLDTKDCQTLLDLGCGPGTYAFHLAMRNPDLRLFLLDLPEVLEVALEIEQRYPIANRVTYLPIDVTKQEIPGSYDLVLVSNTLHMLGEAESRKLLERLYPTVNPGGSLVVQFQYLNEDRLGGRWPIILDLVQLCITESGRNHTISETRRWMLDAGYARIEFCPMSLLNTNGYLRAYRPAPG